MNALLLAANLAFCRIVAPTAVEYAPKMLFPSLRPPTAAEYAAAGWLKNAIAAPTNGVGVVAALDRYEARDGAVWAVYAYSPAPVAPRRWTPLSIKRAAVACSMWDSLKALLVAADAYDDFIMAQYESEEDPQFAALVAAAKAQFGEEAVTRLLDAAEVEP